MNSDSQLSRMLYQSYLVSGSQLSRLLSSDAGTLGWSDPVSHDCGSFVECGPTIMPHSPAKSIFRLHVISSVHTHTHIHTLKRILYTSSCRLLNSRGIAYSAINIWNNMNLFAIVYIHLATCGDLTRLPWTPSLSPVHLPQPEVLLASLATNHRYKVRTWTWRPW